MGGGCDAAVQPRTGSSARSTAAVVTAAAAALARSSWLKAFLLTSFIYLYKRWKENRRRRKKEEKCVRCSSKASEVSADVDQFDSFEFHEGNGGFPCKLRGDPVYRAQQPEEFMLSTPSPSSSSTGPRRQFGLQDDQFRLGKLLQDGGQSCVYACTRIATSKEYAAKVINLRRMGVASKQLSLLRREVRIMRDLHHPNIVNLHCAFWEEGSCIIVMDLARGGDLYRKIESELDELEGRHAVKQQGQGSTAGYRGLSGSEAASKHIARQLLDGIGYMHQNHVVHRDLKLENILIESSHEILKPKRFWLHEVKIADFGLSRVIKQLGKLAPSMTAVGTPAYVAPEVLEENYDERVDLWSFGVIIYAMLCGQMPFDVSSLSPERHKRAVAHIAACEPWRRASSEGRDLVRGLLTINPSERLTCSCCLRHSWLLRDHEIDSPNGQEHPGRQVSAFSCCSAHDARGGTGSFEAAQWVSRVPSGDSDGAARTTSVPLPAVSGLSGGGQPVGVVRTINAVVASAVHWVEFVMVDGSVQTYGDMAGDDLLCAAAQRTWSLQAEEYIIAAMQDVRQVEASSDHLGDSLVFFTSARQIIALQGPTARSRCRFMAPEGCSVAGLQFEGSRLTGIHIEAVPAKGPASSVASLGGRSDAVVDQISFHMRSGQTRTYGGGESGVEKGPWALAQEEYIVIVEQANKDWGLGAAMIFYTSLGNIYKIVGMTGSRSRRVVAPPGQQICDLDFEAGCLKGVGTCSVTGDLSTAAYASTESKPCASGQPGTQ
eukprot:TRINITY_DN6077_c0_g1_i1.p1 TRINITY_DN6077_c0_g1~~TRINITY_DN6077_c0_g1_i1.p1  ORF type:complete len:805 (+),score=196.18 TRINITY_DN6077_c0_g1_i1:97-2415(+)